MNNISESDRLFWERAYLKYFVRLCALAARVLTKGNAEDAEDLVSEAFRRAMTYVKNTAAIESVYAYLWMVVKRLSYSKPTGANSFSMINLDDLAEDEQHPSVEPTAESDLETRELFDRLYANLGPLTPREMLLLKLFLSGYTPKEAAAQLDEDVRITRVDINALKAKLRYRLQKGRAKTTRQGRP